MAPPLFARRDPDTGELAWHYQYTPHDEFDWDANQPPILVDVDWEGFVAGQRRRRVRLPRYPFEHQRYWIDKQSAAAMMATGDKPFLLVQYMSGCYNVITETPSPSSCNQGPTGDPYMIQMPPVEQWLTALPFLTDTSYPRDYVTIIREAGTEVTLDCLGVVSDDHFAAIPGTSGTWVRVTLASFRSRARPISAPPRDPSR